MSEHARIEVHRGKRYRVVLRRTPEAVAPKKKKRLSAKPRRRRHDDTWCIPRWHFFDAGAQVIETLRYYSAAPSDLANRITEIRLETGPIAQPAQIDEVRQLLLESARPQFPPPTYLYSGRSMYANTAAPLAATAEVSGYNMTVQLKRLPLTGQSEQDRITWSRGVQHNAAWCSAMRTPAEQLATWDTLEPDTASGTHRAWKDTRDRIETLLYEKYDFETLPRAQADLTVRSVGITPGLWAPSFVGGGTLFYNWNPEDTANFRTVRSEWAYDPDTSRAPLATCGVGQQTDIYAFLAPRRHRYVYQYIAVYIEAALFAPPQLVIEVVVGTFADRLPLGWTSTNSPGQVVNDTVISQWIGRSNRLAVSFEQDAAQQVVSPYFIKLLVGRVDGLWTVRSGQEFAGDLAAVIDMKRGDRTDRYNIFRRTFVNHDDALIDWGALDVNGIVGMPPSGPIFAYEGGFGPI